MTSPPSTSDSPDLRHGSITQPSLVSPPAFRFILVTLLIDVLGIGLIIPVLPRLVTQMAGGTESHSATIYGLFIAAYAANQFLFAPLLGTLSDTFGRRPVLLISILGTALDYVLMFFAPTLALLFVGRVINGITAANFSTCNAYVADVTPPADRPKRYGAMGACFGIGFILGPMLGGFFGEHHLRWPFAFAAGLAFLNFFYGLFVLPESHPPARRTSFNLRKANPFASLTTLGQFQGVLPLAIVLFLLNFSNFSLHSTWVLYTGHRFHWGPFDVGVSLAAVGVLAALVQGGLTQPIVKRFGLYPTLYLGLIAGSVAFLGYGLAPTGWMMYAIMIPGALGGLIGPAVQSIVTQRVDPKSQGLIQGTLSSLSALAAIFAPLTATSLFAHFSAPSAHPYLPGAPFILGATLTLISAGIAFRTIRTPM